ncbi:MAG: HAMP domain-containing protein, partial [Phenylobacterium sp.]|uniref:HAMP domain-containing protein n=1 Tax=Phenylobacterium sp. TaxID=1871053 RepID=UPI002735A087
MSFLDNLKLTNKSLVPLLCMALLFAGVVAFGAVRLVEMGRRSSDLVEHADPAAARGIRAARAANQVAYDVYRVINYEGDSADAKAALEDVAATAKAGDRFLDEAAQLHPAKAAEYAAFRARFDAIVSDAQGPLAVGLATPGLERGSRLTPAELDAMAGGVRQMVQVDRQITTFVKDLVAFNEALIAENKSKAEALNRAASQAVWSMVIVGLLAILAGVATSIWMTLTKITRPLGRLGERMETLAGGDLRVEVEGQGRRDEIGAMARTVQVFKDNALKLRAAETAAEEQRNLAEAE